MKMPQKLETKTPLMMEKMIQLMARTAKVKKIKIQVNQKQLKMQPMQQNALQEMRKTPLTMLKITPKN